VFWECAEPESGVKVIMDRNEGWIELHCNPDHFPVGVGLPNHAPLIVCCPVARDACEIGRSHALL